VVIDILGTNCSGKSTLISKSKEAYKIRHLDLFEYLTKHPQVAVPCSQQLRLVVKHPQSAAAFGGICRHGGTQLALRYWKYFTAHATMAGNVAIGEIAISDEGVLKKLYEVIPFVDSGSFESQHDKWVRFAANTKRALLESVSRFVDIVIVLETEPKTYLARVQERNFFVKEIGEERVLNRYLVQREVYRQIAEEGATMGFRIHRIDTTEMVSATEQFLQVVSEAEVAHCGKRITA
jgi:thymidylate kinase